MDVDAVYRLCQAAMWTVIVIVTPVVVIAALVGLLVAVAEALTSVQDQTIGTAARLLAVLALLFLFGSAAGSYTLRFAKEQFQVIPYIGRSSGS